MASSFIYKPELALRRALELESIKQHGAALELLSEVLGGSRRQRTWAPIYEQIMIVYLKLCLHMQKSREAKDGLHQYRNLSQSQAPGSLEKVMRYVMEEAEKRAHQAKVNAEAVAKTMGGSTEEGDTGNSGAADDGDEEADGFGASPQAVLMSTMSTDPEKTQRDSALLMPALKFLWEIYRAVLDILKTNSKLERVYHAAAIGALKFCREFKRRTEFRRLCDMVRVHLSNLQKFGVLTVPPTEDGKPNNKFRGWEGWTTEGIELHLQTRFAQLDTASVLHLYTEGFRTVEDIYNILQISHARRKADPSVPPPKAKLMAAYYEKLTTLFWVSENYLFHAFAWYKYYSLCREYNRGMSEEMKQMQASAVLLATLCIPNYKSSTSSQQQHGITSTVEDDIMKEKMARMATLLGFHTRYPTREALLTEIRSKNLMDNVPPYLKELYLLLEENSDPLVMVDQAQPLLVKLQQEVGATNDSDEGNVDIEDDSLARYVKPLTSVLLIKLLLNLSAAYHTVSMDHLKKLTSGLGVTFDQVEKAIVSFTQTKTLSVRIDHRAGCLRFGDPKLESDAMRSQLTPLSKRLETVCNILSPPDDAAVQQARAALYATVRANIASEHTAILERKDVIEKRKEEVERLAQEKIKAAEQQRLAEAALRKAEEEKRLAKEQQLREQEKQRKIQQEMEAIEKKKYLEAMGRNTEAMTEEEMAQVDTAALAKEHAEKANKKKEEAERKLRETAKRLDYLVRAVRIEELPQIRAKYEEKVNQDKKEHEAAVTEAIKTAKADWENQLEQRELIAKITMLPEKIAEFKEMVMKSRKVRYELIKEEEDQRAEQAGQVRSCQSPQGGRRTPPRGERKGSIGRGGSTCRRGRAGTSRGRASAPRGGRVETASSRTGPYEPRTRS